MLNSVGCCFKHWNRQQRKIFTNTIVNVTSRTFPSYVGKDVHCIQGWFYVRDNGYKLSSLKFSLVDAKRHISTSSCYYGVNVRPMKITSRLAADQLIRDMDEGELNRLSKALEHLKQEIHLEKDSPEDPPSFRSLSLLAFSNSLPFLGFGFLDNAIMISAGEYIDITVGAMLGISTMAAAAIGNMISDVAGIGLAGYVEALVQRMGFEGPQLSSKQLRMRSVRLACHSGRAVGIVIGCVVGMFPLLLIRNKDHEKLCKEKET